MFCMKCLAKGFRRHEGKSCETGSVYLKTTGEGPQNLCRVFLMLSLRVDSSRYQVLWSDAEGPAVGSTEIHHSQIII